MFMRFYTVHTVNFQCNKSKPYSSTQIGRCSYRTINKKSDSHYVILIIKQQQTSFVLRLHYDKCLYFFFLKLKFLPIWDALYIGALIT